MSTSSADFAYWQVWRSQPLNFNWHLGEWLQQPFKLQALHSVLFFRARCFFRASAMFFGVGHTHSFFEDCSISIQLWQWYPIIMTVISNLPMVSDFNWYLVSSLMTQWWLNSFTSPFATTWMVNANLSFLCAVCHGFSSRSSSKCIKRKPQIWFKYTICPYMSILLFFVLQKPWEIQGQQLAFPSVSWHDSSHNRPRRHVRA